MGIPVPWGEELNLIHDSLAHLYIPNLPFKLCSASAKNAWGKCMGGPSAFGGGAKFLLWCGPGPWGEPSLQSPPNIHETLLSSWLAPKISWTLAFECTTEKLLLHCYWFHL